MNATGSMALLTSEILELTSKHSSQQHTLDQVNL